MSFDALAGRINDGLGTTVHVNDAELISCDEYCLYGHIRVNLDTKRIDLIHLKSSIPEI